jgi:photosystem II stability/assembly factor-like uncharacterized protein
MDPTNPNHLLAGTDHLYETTDGATSWTEKSPSLAASTSTSNPFGAISALAIAPTDPNNTFYVGTGDGKIWVTTNDGGSWTDITAGTVGTTGPFGRYVTALAVNPTNASDVDVAFSGFSGATGGHVYNSTNGGKTWSDFSTGLPDTPVNAIVRDPTNAPVRYLGTDVGFFFTTDGGASWQQDQTGLPNTSINQLFTDKNFTTFVAATHGRGMFTLPVSALGLPSNTPTPVPATNTPTATPTP